jgi:hypothetical protein
MKSSWSFIMHSRYVQILHTYTRRFSFWMWLFVLSAQIIPLAGEVIKPGHPPTLVTWPGEDPAIAKQIEHSNRDSDTAAAQFRHIRTAQLCMVMGFIYLLDIMANLKRQIASPRAVLLPGYRGPHLVVAAGLSLPVILLQPLLISAAYHFPAASVTAVMMSDAALLLWAIYLRSPLLGLIIVPIWFGPYLPAGQRALAAALGQTPLPVALGLIAIDVAALFQLARRLLALREEMPEYARTVATDHWDNPHNTTAQVSVGAGRNWNSRLQRFFAGRSDRRFDHLPATPTFLRDRLGRWSLTTSSSALLYLFVIALAGQAIGITCGAGKYPWGLLVIQLAVLPLVPLLGLHMRVWPTLGFDSLRPLRRAEYLRERALAITVDTAQLWFVLAAVIIGAAAVLSPPTLRLWDFWLSVAGSVFLQVPVLAVLFWVLRFRSTRIYSVMGAAIALLMMGVISLAPEARFSLLTSQATPFIAGGVVLLSMLILCDAYRRWLRTDLA